MPPAEATAAPLPVRGAVSGERLARAARAALGRGTLLLYLSVIVLLPLAALLARGFDGGLDAFWKAVTAPDAKSALIFTIVASLIVVLVNAVFGTLVAWVLVRDEFRGKAAVNAIIDLPFALPTIVAGLTLLALYGPRGPLGIDVAYTRAAVLLALAFVTLPFVVRAVQPVLMELDRDMEDAAASLGARSSTIFRRIVLPNLMPAILAGGGLALARCLGEFGSVVLISGNIPNKTEVGSVFISKQIEGDNLVGAAAVSVALLVLSLVMLLIVGAIQARGARHAR